MENYNIYVNDIYLFTSLCESPEAASHLAKEEAFYYYDLIPDLDEDEAFEIASKQVKIDEDVHDLAHELYIKERNKHINYKFVLTSYDTIPESDLIYDYIIESDDSGETIGS